MKSPRRGTTVAAVSALVTGFVAAAGARAVPLAAHDANVVRSVGFGFTGIFRALDTVIAAPLLLAPLGTRAFRAGLASALLAAMVAAVAVVVIRELMSVVVPEVVARLGARGERHGASWLIDGVSAAAV